MFQSKFFLIMSAVIVVALAASVTFMALEMDTYSMFQTMFAKK